MKTDALATAFVDALDARHVSARPVRFWLRDDDAIHPTGALEQLLGLTEKYSIPLVLAVIPESTGEELANRLVSDSQVSVAVHGWSHRNYALHGEKTQELGDHRSADVVLNELSEGIARLVNLHGPRFVPVLVPPWNRISPVLTGKLRSLGFQGLSTFGSDSCAPERPVAEKREIESAGNATTEITTMNTQVDLIDWKGTRGGRDRGALLQELSDLVRAGADPIGFLTHHLDHDAAAWDFLDELFVLTSQHPGARWISIKELLPG